MNVNIVLIEDRPVNLDHMVKILAPVDTISFEGEFVYPKLHPMGPVLKSDRRVDLNATLGNVSKLCPGVAIIDMRLEGDEDDDYSGLRLAACIKEQFANCCIILVSTYMQSIADIAKYLAIFQYRVDRGQEPSRYQEDLKANFINAVKTHVSTEKYLLNTDLLSQTKSDTDLAIYISYAWREADGCAHMVSRLYDSLRNSRYEVRMDKTDIKYTKPISAFMNELARSDCVVMVVSESYLHSPHCMSELLEISNNKNFEKRVVPILFDDVNIHKPSARLKYLLFWKQETERLEEQVLMLGLRNLLENGSRILNDLRNYQNICNKLDEMLAALMDMNCLTVEQIEANDFALIKDAIDSCLAESID